MSTWSVFDIDYAYPGVLFTGEHAEASAHAYGEVRRAQGATFVSVEEVRAYDVTPEQAAFTKTVYSTAYSELLSEEEKILRKIFGESLVRDPGIPAVEAIEVDIAHPHPVFGLCAEITEPVQAYTISDDEVLFVGLDHDAVEEAWLAYPKKS